MSDIANIIAEQGVSVTPYTLTDSTVDAGGAVIRSWSAGTAFTMYLQPSMTSEPVEAGARRTTSGARGYTSVANTLTQGMRLVYGSLTYEVLGFYTPDFRTSPNALAYQIVELQSVGGLA